MNLVFEKLTCTMPRLVGRVPAVVRSVTESIYRYAFFIRTEVLGDATSSVVPV